MYLISPRATQSLTCADTEVLRPSARTLSLYRDAFKTHGRCEAALLWTKNKQSARFEALCRSIPDAGATLLDFGCGLGDLAQWLSIHRPTVRYAGTDALEEFVADNRRTLGKHRFTQISTPHDIVESYAHIVCCGVFNLDPDNDPERHWRHVRETIAVLYSKARVSLHVDFLAHDVDYRQPNTYHQNLADLIAFIEGNISRRYCVDRSYMPYEYCISIFADQEIEHGRNVYAAIPT